MKELTSFSHYSHALRLQQALTTAGVEATITSEAANAYIGTEQFTVWIADHADPAVVRRVGAEIDAHSAELKIQPTLVSLCVGFICCRGCGYDLRGQTQNGNCPECGRPYRIILSKRCPQCGENAPADFDICWQCGTEFPPAAAFNS
jgi:hypothetical protein